MAVLLLAALPACTFVKLHQNTSHFYASTVLVGHVASTAPWTRPVVVAALERRDGRLQVAHHTVLHEAGSYELIVPKGEYRVVAFGDANANLALDDDEPAGQFEQLVAVTSSGGVRQGLDLLLSAGKPPAELRGLVAGQPVLPLHSTQIGAIAQLETPRFSAAAGSRGYWEPFEFFRELGGNVYFLEEYDPKKIPVLFVHGANGSLQDWRYFLDHLDRSRYQPWLFLYPSGASLDSMANLLYWKLLNLRAKTQFDEIYLTAHSMGGLVVRSFLLNHGHEFPQVRLFISISSPWGGDSWATVGVAHAPAVVPSWYDMRPGGRFIQALFARRLPPNLDYYLFFSYRGRYSVIRPTNNDGAITLASQLVPEAQADAKRVYGFNEDHVTILSSPEVFAQYAALLDATDRKHQERRTAAGGKLRLQFDYAQPSDSPRAPALLVLLPLDRSRERITLPLNVHDTGREFGPFPPGEYEAALLASVYQTRPAKARVTIAPGTTPALSFTFVPQGALAGYISAKVEGIDHPAGSERPASLDLNIRSIRLSGPAGVRQLTPVTGSANEFLDATIAGRDYAYQAYFSFVDLPPGRYQLSVQADGFEPYAASYQIVPGGNGYLKSIELTPLRPHP